ncbi:MAG: polysaccharide deacetylase family protein [Methylococcus sp.]|nr:polysaccharide deacetylase family protein [Methylococcus sp.]
MFKRVIIKGLARSGANAAMRRINRHGITVLMYHGVMEDEFGAADEDWLQVRASEFRSQMRYLREHFHVVPLERVRETPSGGKPRAVLTFDDGYANNFRVAYPILREFGFPATVFLVTGAVGSRQLFWFDRLQLALKGRVVPDELKRIKEQFKANTHPHEIDAAVDAFLRKTYGPGAIPERVVEAYRPLSRDEIGEMAASGLVRFGSHTHRHEILTRLSPAEAEQTLAQSLGVLKALPGCGGYFCFPNGDWSPEHVRLCQRLGFEGALLTRPGVWRAGVEAFGIPRFGIGRGMDTAAFAATVSGILPGIQRALRR